GGETGDHIDGLVTEWRSATEQWRGVGSDVRIHIVPGTHGNLTTTHIADLAGQPPVCPPETSGRWLPGWAGRTGTARHGSAEALPQVVPRAAVEVAVQDAERGVAELLVEAWGLEAEGVQERQGAAARQRLPLRRRKQSPPVARASQIFAHPD